MRDPDDTDQAALRTAALHLFESTEFQSPQWPPSILWAHVAALGVALYGPDDPRVVRLRDVDSASQSQGFAAVPLGSRWRLAAGRACVVMAHGEGRSVRVRCDDGERLSLSMAYLLEYCTRQADGTSSTQRLGAQDDIAQRATELREESDAHAANVAAQLEAAALANSPPPKGRPP